MANYHSYLSDTDFVADAVLVVTGGSEQVAVEVADRLTIDGPGERRIDALVLERDDRTMTIALAEGRAVSLRITETARFADLSLSEGFSRQCWVVV